MYRWSEHIMHTATHNKKTAVSKKLRTLNIFESFAHEGIMTGVGIVRGEFKIKETSPNKKVTRKVRKKSFK
jgi:hypothetical protein